jgi:hypothetical protein
MDWIQGRIHRTLMSNPRMVTAERNVKIVRQCTVQLQWPDVLKKHYMWTLLRNKIHYSIPFWSLSDIVGIIEAVFTITPVLVAKPHSVSIVNDSFCMENFCQLLLNRDSLTLILLTWRIFVWWAPNNASRRQMGFNSAFKGLMGHISCD